MSVGRLIYFIAIGVLVSLVLVVLKFAISGAITKQHVWEAVKVTVGLICMVLVALWRHGNIAPWGAWVGFGVAIGLLLAGFLVGRAKNEEPRL